MRHFEGETRQNGAENTVFIDVHQPFDASGPPSASLKLLPPAPRRSAARRAWDACRPKRTIDWLRFQAKNDTSPRFPDVSHRFSIEFQRRRSGFATFFKIPKEPKDPNTARPPLCHGQWPEQPMLHPTTGSNLLERPVAEAKSRSKWSPGGKPGLDTFWRRNMA